MRSLLLHAAADGNFEVRLQLALDLARRLDAHLTCLHVMSLEFTVPGDFYGQVGAAMVPVIRDQADNFRKEQEARLRDEDVRWDWISEAGIPETRLVYHSALSDLLILGAAPRGSASRAAAQLAGAIAIHSRAPVLIVPADHDPLDLDRPAMVAWNGSVEASRALRAAVPLLAMAREVHMVTVSEARSGSDYELPSARGAEFLSRHGIECEIFDLPRGDGPIADILRDAARSRHAGLMVMGAFGHSRLREMLFGGATQAIFDRPEIPILAAH